jgi:hypothetical protein
LELYEQFAKFSKWWFYTSTN